MSYGKEKERIWREVEGRRRRYLRKAKGMTQKRGRVIWDREGIELYRERLEMGRREEKSRRREGRDGGENEKGDEGARGGTEREEGRGRIGWWDKEAKEKKR